MATLKNKPSSLLSTSSSSATYYHVVSTAAMSLSTVYVCYGILRMSIKYWKFRTNPLRSDPTLAGPFSVATTTTTTSETSTEGSTDSAVNTDKSGGGGGGSFLWGQFWVIRKAPFMVPHRKWIEQSCVGWDAPFLFYTLLFGKPSICLLDKNIVKTVLMAPYSKEPVRFVKNLIFLQNIIGDGLVTLQGEPWMRHRSIIQPAFLAQSTKQMLTDLIPQLTTKLIRSWKLVQGHEIDLTAHLSALTLEIIGLAGFSHEFGALDHIQNWAEEMEKAASTSTSCDSGGGVSDGDHHELAELDDPFIKAFTQAFQLTTIGAIAFILGMPLINRLFNPKTRRVREAMNTSVDRIIQKTKAKNNESQTEDSSVPKSSTSTRPSVNRSRKSLLELLLDARDGESKKSLDDMELCDEIKTFLFAGHETTSTWCYFAVWSLCMNRAVQEKVFQDVMKHSPANLDEPLGFQTIEKMEYFYAFMQEVLRFHPPIGQILRATTQDETFGTVTVRKGTRMTIPIYLLHRHPKYWDAPEDFLPERWIFSNDKEREAFMSRIQFAFLPFSFGGRNCIGKQFAVIEAHMIMAELIRNFHFAIAPSQNETKFTFSNVVALKTKPRLKVVMKTRSVPNDR